MWRSSRSGIVVLGIAMLACGDPEGGSSGQAGTAGASGAGGTGGAGSAGGGSGGKSAGGTNGSGGSSTGGANGGTNGSSGSAGVGGTTLTECTCPATVPLSGDACSVCDGPVCAYEDCDGEGFVQAGCGGDWFLVTTVCGDKPCGPEGAPEMNCAPGSACILLIGGALQGYGCVPHDCGSGAITCACIAANCPGECTRTGGTSFTCNTCPSGSCP
jgi:hypothetical protein